MMPHQHHRRAHFRPNPMFVAFFIVESLFWALAATCVMSALHRIGSALKLQARMEALEKHADAFTDEERQQLIHKIKTRSLGCI
mgnify:CR=1 FL=1